MYILGIETSCDDTAAAVIKAEGGLKKPSFSVLSNLSYSQVATHRKFGGVVPNLASRDHLKKIIPTIKTALERARLKEKQIDLIAVTRGPGLAPSLLVGINTARALAYAWKKPVIGVNHIEGHIYSNWLEPIGVNPKSEARNPKQIKFPALILIVSGGHTELVLMQNYGKYKIIGWTRDDAAGEAFDKTARLLGLRYPGGPAIAAEADKFKILNLKFKITLPRPMINSNDFDFSFSGLKTAVLYAYQDLIKKYAPKVIRPAMSFEVQQAITEVLVAKTLKAAKKYRPKTVMIAGGVAANKNLREKMTETFGFLKIPFLVPEMPYTTDNAAMIAACGYFRHLAKKTSRDSWKKIKMSANLKL
ncbi:tRNA (adenosine(37)-N6)-threonylcarbamoyltransferase complex transferase subunit TsaD [Candidatus Azambacteria bacterium RIFCSPHIGHO2_01_FULL_44_55]|uniref:tRNA N6-adenosine threonylcarbamoyltransferase n=1 Tax=Candidatus Azambacteria bacterium RIFCSPLOWO2_02_FULL_44_14 TaxID=1797306 RepID=A0A1F5CCP6_9BACT|nr:MAG: tRNA (adenosine(37)-N6)-threonylcarbamoyltransferase complex transferase subunit TsaD [Candidatus Azambacteria bacterium RIFCSPLOWO2_01_FULL_44_84]OGD32951.1 MAG: tRNA (adenosine(37)-N6)-threonylcarbamoyltransferase complex transferase subunit TsaD [Candidatus Azambacteria bacterium RIFCSPHIGHO2_02_FULL_45_18]OGD40395.1 MAG: tRNA (adenosine(37)-N6)-threonylcarbamoyltransferase complex transferase subunit TsaD [Candidatus Azambacteria bacterium RIFCSPHIGHO2_01_FULL_44_55]OGD40607.1 MAG: t